MNHEERALSTTDNQSIPIPMHHKSLYGCFQKYWLDYIALLQTQWMQWNDIRPRIHHFSLHFLPLLFLFSFRFFLFSFFLSPFSSFWFLFFFFLFFRVFLFSLFFLHFSCYCIHLDVCCHYIFVAGSARSRCSFDHWKWNNGEKELEGSLSSTSQECWQWMNEHGSFLHVFYVKYNIDKLDKFCKFCKFIEFS